MLQKTNATSYFLYQTVAIPLFIPLWVFQLTNCRHKPLEYQFSKVLLGVFIHPKVLGHNSCCNWHKRFVCDVVYIHFFSKQSLLYFPLFGKYVILYCMKNAINFTKLNLICLLLHIQSDTFKLSSHLKFQISQPFFSHIQQAFFHQRHFLMPCNT